MALCATTALAGAVSRLCVRGARGRFGGVRAGTWCCVSPSSPFPPRVFRAACGGPSCPGVPYPRSLVRHSMRSVRSARSVRLPFRWSPRVLFVRVRSRSRGVRSPLGGVARASRVVPALGAGRAVPCGPCPSACPAPVPCSVWRAWGGAVRSRFPPTGLGVVGAAAGRPRGVPSTVAWGVRGLALLFRLPVLWVGCRGLRCGRGRAVVGAPLCSCRGGERCRLGVQAPVRRIPMTSPMRTELRPAGCVGGLG